MLYKVYIISINILKLRIILEILFWIVFSLSNLYIVIYVFKLITFLVYKYCMIGMILI